MTIIRSPVRSIVSSSARSAVGSDAAVIARMTVDPDATRRALINTLVASLKTAGVWDKLDVLYVVAAHDAQAGRLNWKNDTRYDLTLNGAPTFTADRGYAGNGSNASLSTGFTPSTAGAQFAVNSASIGAWARSDITGATEYTIGQISGSTPTALIRPRSTATTLVGAINNAGTTTIAGVTTAIGLTSVNRSAADAQQFYKNGVSLGTGTVASTARPTSAVHLLRAFSTYSSNEVAAAFMGASLTAGEHLALYNALNVYLTAVGAA